MSYDDTYQAVVDLYDPEEGWDELVHVGDRDGLNLGEEALGRHGDSETTALRLRDFETGDVERYSFAELNARANRFANYLVEHTTRGARVAAMLPTRVELYAVVFGTLKAGRVYVPLSPVFGPDAAGHRLDDAGATVLVTDAAHRDRIGSSVPDCVERVLLVEGEPEATRAEPYATVAAHDDAFEAVETHPDDPFALSYTSGTTGQPKGVPLEHSGVPDLHAFIEYVVDLRPDDTYFVAASPAWSYGLVMGTIAPGLRGTAIGCYRGEFDGGMLMDTLARLEVDNAMVPPTALRQLANAGVEAEGIDLRVLLAAGESLDEDSVGWCRDVLGTEPQDSYGMTESGMTVCNFAFPDWEVKPGSMGRPLPGTEVALLDPDADERVPQGEVGEIAIRREAGDGGSYWGRPEASMATFTGPWLRTDDLARKDEDGYLWYVGRKDSVIVSAGHRIGPGEVEETLLKHDAVAEVAVVGVPDETRGELVKAFVATAGVDHSADLADDIRSFAREQLSKHEYPREIEFMDELPKTATGKIARSELEPS
ncbi:acyl-CoA synthetase [Haloglomus litoreum]|uniref:acyl-CoA synthetase n=1 Tax=Haloglomus litoreum TaxID=3034026 RepID=UPI0023E7D0C5|nr:AMP-binding protein [Haloglomus sp. DT116]